MWVRPTPGMSDIAAPLRLTRVLDDHLAPSDWERIRCRHLLGRVLVIERFDDALVLAGEIAMLFPVVVGMEQKTIKHPPALGLRIGRCVVEDPRVVLIHRGHRPRIDMALVVQSERGGHVHPHSPLDIVDKPVNFRPQMTTQESHRAGQVETRRSPGELRISQAWICVPEGARSRRLRLALLIGVDEVVESGALENQCPPIDDLGGRPIRANMEQHIQAIHVLREHLQGVAVDVEHVRILQVFQRCPPIDLPALLSVHHQCAVVEEFRWDVFLNWCWITLAHPDEHEALVGLGGVRPRRRAPLLGEYRVWTLAEERQGSAVLVESQPVIGARDGALEMARALGE